MVGLKEWQVQKDNGIFDKRNQVNSLTGKEWLFSTRSVKTKEYDYFFDYIKAFDSKFINSMPVELIIELIMTFTKPKSIIIDPVSNFGSIGQAISHINSDLKYFGFNIKNHSLLSIKTNKNVSFYEKDILTFTLSINNSETIHLFSELIFTTLNPASREKEYKKFEFAVQESLGFLFQNKIKLKYVILCLQNTRDESNYVYHSKSVKTVMEKLNFNLKSELIWKIHDKDFLKLKSHILSKNDLVSHSNLILNDKRILVFKMD